MTSSMTADKYVNQESNRLSCDFTILRQSPIFSGVHHDVVKLLAYLSTHRSFQPGDYLIEQGKRANQAFILINGIVEITVQHRGKEIVLQRYYRSGDPTASSTRDDLKDLLIEWFIGDVFHNDTIKKMIRDVNYIFPVCCNKGHYT